MDFLIIFFRLWAQFTTRFCFAGVNFSEGLSQTSLSQGKKQLKIFWSTQNPLTDLI